MAFNRTQCPAGVPETNTLPIPQNLSFVVIPTTNTNATFLVVCCQPNPVHLAADCFAWCEIPPAYQKSTAQETSSALELCLRANEGNDTSNLNGGFAVHMASEAVVRKPGVSVLTLFVGLMAMSALM